MIEEGIKRKLTAILSTNVEGYCHLMNRDESVTIRTQLPTVGPRLKEDEE